MWVQGGSKKNFTVSPSFWLRQVIESSIKHEPGNNSRNYARAPKQKNATFCLPRARARAAVQIDHLVWGHVCWV